MGFLMKRVAIFILILSIFSPLFADGKYKIQLGIYANIKNAENIKKHFPDDESLIKTKKNGKRHYLYIVNFESIKDANERLYDVKKIIPKAFILKQKPEKKEIVKKEIKTIEPKTIEFIQDIEVLPPKPLKVIEKTIKKDNNISKKLEKKIDIIKDVKIGITLKEAILISLNKSNKISSAKQKVIQAKRKVDEKRAGYKPKIVLYTTAGETYQHIRGDDGLEDNYFNGSAEISLTQNLYSGRKVTNSVKKEIENLKITTYKYRSLVEEEITNIIDAYISVIYEKKSIETNRENMENLQKILNIVTKKEQSGASSKGDLNYIKSNVENAKALLVKAESKYQNALSYYEYFIGEIDKTNMPLEEDFKFTLETKEITLEKMQKYNAKIQQTKAQILVEKYDFEAKKAPFKPNLDLIVSAKHKNTKSETTPSEDRANIALSLSYNLYNGGKDKAALLKVKSKIQELKYKLIDLQESTRFNTIQMYENLTSSLSSLEHTKKEVQANQKVIKSYWSAFKYGEQDIQALLLAQRALNRSQLDQIKERKNYVSGYFKLKAQTGEIFIKVGLIDFVNPDKIIQDRKVSVW